VADIVATYAVHAGTDIVPAELATRIRQAVADPGHFVPRGADSGGEPDTEPVSSWSARAVVAVLAAWLSTHPPVVPEPDGYMVATGSGDVVVPLAFRGSKQDAVSEWTARHRKYPSAALYALHRAGESHA
jgi:hypothetical protein